MGLLNDAVLLSVAAAVTGSGLPPFSVQYPHHAWETAAGQKLLRSVNTVPLMAWWTQHLGDPWGIGVRWLPSSWTHEVPSTSTAVWTGVLVCASQWALWAYSTGLPLYQLPTAVGTLATWLAGLDRHLEQTQAQVTTPVLANAIQVATYTPQAFIEHVCVPDFEDGHSSEELLPLVRPEYATHQMWWRALGLAVRFRYKLPDLFTGLLNLWWTVEPLDTWTPEQVDQCVFQLVKGLGHGGVWWHELLCSIEGWTCTFTCHQSLMLVHFAVALMRQVVSWDDVEDIFVENRLRFMFASMFTWVNTQAAASLDVHEDLQQWSHEAF